ncbi:MAG TPA: magnesium transporter [Candidatus Krumholzibacteria bacterium]|nr:magnesium transporter [Candidatus Krumholzibacteria bacterium]
MTTTDERSDRLAIDDLRNAWVVLSADERVLGFGLLSPDQAEEFFLSLDGTEAAELLAALPPQDRRRWMRLIPPDDAADVIQAASEEMRPQLLDLLDDFTRREVSALLAYAEDRAGGLMNPRYARLRPDMSVDEAIAYLRRQVREHLELIYYAYVVTQDHTLQGVVSFRELLAAAPDKLVRNVMRTDVITVDEQMDQEKVSHIFAEHDLIAIPVVDAQHHMKGIVTVDDIVDVVEEEATEDIQKMGGTAALGAPYLSLTHLEMVKKRIGWLAALFVGEMLTATAMAYFEDEIARAVVLALFVPLIISSGGNSGSQASTLVIRAMALGELKLRDWWRVMQREFLTGLMLGSVLGAIGFLRVIIWQAVKPVYGPHYLYIAFTVFFSLIGVIMFGTLVGSLLPFILRKFKIDPATASAPFVATLVDVTGLVIYFTVAILFLSGKLL